MPCTTCNYILQCKSNLNIQWNKNKIGRYIEITDIHNTARMNMYLPEKVLILINNETIDQIHRYKRTNLF